MFRLLEAIDFKPEHKSHRMAAAFVITCVFTTTAGCLSYIDTPEFRAHGGVLFHSLRIGTIVVLLYCIIAYYMVLIMWSPSH
jgi:hypothetical protein